MDSQKVIDQINLLANLYDLDLNTFIVIGDAADKLSGNYNSSEDVELVLKPSFDEKNFFKAHKKDFHVFQDNDGNYCYRSNWVNVILVLNKNFEAPKETGCTSEGIVFVKFERRQTPNIRRHDLGSYF